MARSFLAAFLALAAASPAPIQQREVESSKILFRYHHEGGANATEVTASSADKATVFGSSCSNSLDLDGSRITFDVDETGSGHLQIGDVRHEISGDLCRNIYGADMAATECDVPWDSLDNLPIVDATGVEDCFPEDADDRIRHLPGSFGSPLAPLHEEKLAKRQGGCAYFPDTVDHYFVGDGSIRDVWLRQQKTPTLECKDGDCSTGYGRTVTTSVDASISVSGAGWVSLGLGVSYSHASSWTSTCNAGPWEKVCVQVDIRHKQYHVTEQRTTNPRSCLGRTTYTNYWIDSPWDVNADRYYCMRGDECRWDGWQQWES